MLVALNFVVLCAIQLFDGCAELVRADSTAGVFIVRIAPVKQFRNYDTNYQLNKK